MIQFRCALLLSRDPSLRRRSMCECFQHANSCSVSKEVFALAGLKVAIPPWFANAARALRHAEVRAAFLQSRSWRRICVSFQCTSTFDQTKTRKLSCKNVNWLGACRAIIQQCVLCDTVCNYYPENVKLIFNGMSLEFLIVCPSLLYICIIQYHFQNR